jgi:hypothetical protein
VKQLLSGATSMRDQLSFRCSLINGLLAAGQDGELAASSLVARPAVLRQSRAAPLPDTRLIGAQHLPVWGEKQNRCALCTYHGERGETKMYCSSCKKYLCCQSKRNCFLEFHVQDGAVVAVLGEPQSGPVD